MVAICEAYRHELSESNLPCLVQILTVRRDNAGIVDSNNISRARKIRNCGDSIQNDSCY